MPADDLTLALIAFPSLTDWYIRWASSRADDTLHTGIRSLLGEVCALLRPQVGFVFQRHELASSLRAFPKHVSEAEIEKLSTSREAWEKLCSETHASTYKLLKDNEDNYEFWRDPFEPIEPILDSERPLDHLDRLLDDAYRALPVKGVDPPIERATALRDLLFFATLVDTTLRRKNLGDLDYTPDNRGRLRRIEGHYVIVIPARECKKQHFNLLHQRQPTTAQTDGGVNEARLQEGSSGPSDATLR